MDRLYEQLRVRSLNLGKTNREPYSTREEQTPPRKTVAFKEGKKQSSFAKQLSRQMSEVDETSNYGFATAIAAAAYAVNKLQEGSPNRKVQANGLQNRLTKTKSENKNGTDSHKPSRWFSGSKKYEEEQRKVSGQNAAPILKTPSLKIESGKLNLANSGPTDTKADAWEKVELAKIQKRYEKTNSSIVEWESRKKTKARRRLEQNEAELQQERAKAAREYNEELAKINMIVAGARSVTEEKKKKDESKIKRKANMIRSTGEVPRSCFLF